MIIEIIVGVAFAIGLFYLQIRLSRKVNAFILQKAELENKYKASQCQIIIGHLQEILEYENIAKECLNNYPVGDSVDEIILHMTKFTIKNAVRSFPNRIEKMKDAIRQLEGKLNNINLREEFLEYVGSFNYLPRHILELKILEHEEDYHRKALVGFINRQIPQIKEFIKRFGKEMESGLAEKREEDQSVTLGTIDHSKYFIGPKL